MAAQLLKLCMDLLTGKGKYRYCLRVGTFGTESAVRKRGGSRNNSSAQVDVYGIWYMIVEKAG